MYSEQICVGESLKNFDLLLVNGKFIYFDFASNGVHTIDIQIDPVALPMVCWITEMPPEVFHFVQIYNWILNIEYLLQRRLLLILINRKGNLSIFIEKLSDKAEIKQNIDLKSIFFWLSARGVKKYEWMCVRTIFRRLKLLFCALRCKEKCGQENAAQCTCIGLGLVWKVTPLLESQRKDYLNSKIMCYYYLKEFTNFPCPFLSTQQQNRSCAPLLIELLVLFFVLKIFLSIFFPCSTRFARFVEK